MRKKETEKSLQVAIMTALGLRGWRCIKMPPSIYTSGKGIPDLLCMRDGITAWIEVKTEKGRLSPQQQRFGQMVDDAGGLYIVARSVDFAVRTLETVRISFFDKNGNQTLTVSPARGMRLTVSEKDIR